MELDDRAHTITVDYIDWPNSPRSTLTFHLDALATRACPGPTASARGLPMKHAPLRRAKLLDAGAWTFEQPLAATHGYDTAPVCVIPTNCGCWPHLDVIEATRSRRMP
ncbi:MAG: hypothetical protein E6J90_40505 [Deltaproteobacteria bacterium]|nr:MAG: hypothetical protein E6J90_40505 [Deltaproteobacteria bacterium]